ncbi:MAG: ATP-dependent helicase [Planctomycetota bacterium]
MPITQAQKQHAEQQQAAAACDPAPQVRLLAGPGTGKSKTIEKRVVHLLGQGVAADGIFVVSFTRLTCKELRQRTQAACAPFPFAAQAANIPVSTMHSLALRILRRANLLTAYPSTPMLLDDWEQTQVYDAELAAHLGCQPGRASEIRLAYDAEWQTLNPAQIAQAQITPQEIAGFQSFHGTRTHLYSCVLPGEVIHRCVEAIQQGALTPAQLPTIAHLIVDEYQDLNACDQEFIRLLTINGAVLFVAGDDDQSIYSFRHANPDGIVNFLTPYPNASTHILTDCFRCTPAVLTPADRLIQHNPNRVAKNIVSLYAASQPPVPGTMAVWSCGSVQQEAQIIAGSCEALRAAGLQGREDEIVILIANRRVQLAPIQQELTARGLPFSLPRGKSLVDEQDGVRAGYTILRLIRDITGTDQDYPAYRDLLELLTGVGAATSKAIGDGCITNNQNFRGLFHAQPGPAWLTARGSGAFGRATAVVQAVSGWSLTDTIATRQADLDTLLRVQVFNSGALAATAPVEWQTFLGTLPPQMTLEELLAYLSADDEAEQDQILSAVNERTGQPAAAPAQVQAKRIRILTMHGAKGLSGSVVFIPGAETGLMPSFRALQATGLLIEQRRLPAALRCLPRSLLPTNFATPSRTRPRNSGLATFERR